MATAENPLRRQWKLSEKFVVGYSGNLGRVHEFETILGAAGRLSKDPRIVFLCIGGGRLFEMLAQATREQGLQQQFLFYPYQSRDVLKYSLSVPDVHWVSLRPQFEGLVVPSKFYAAAAAGRPIIAITSRTSEIATLVQHHDCGIVVEPGDIGALVDGLTLLMNDPSLRATMGARARAMVDIQFTKMHAVRGWARLINELQSQQKICDTTKDM